MMLLLLLWLVVFSWDFMMANFLFLMMLLLLLWLVVFNLFFYLFFTFFFLIFFHTPYFCY
jgi:hypothetical protein